MITKLTTPDELKQIFIEILLNRTDLINDVSQESVLNGFAFACAKIGQKALVNIAVIEGHLFPDTAYGAYLDALAQLRGVSPRFGELGSSTYVRLYADEGTTYMSDITTLTSLEGVTFALEDDVVIGINGYAYAKVRSNITGARTNVNPLSINRINPIPDGHIAVTNEYRATGGRDIEDDDLFRIRIKESANQLARGTISYLEQIFMKINNNVLKLYPSGVSADGQTNLVVVSVNGADFTEAEFDEILSKSEEFLTLTELTSFESGFALNLQNPNWLPVDVDFRVDIDPAYNRDNVRREIQVQMGKLFDYRFWRYGKDKVEWTDLYYVARNVEGVRYLPDANFNPSESINVPRYRLPRIRGFIVRDLDGNILEDNNNVLADFFYPNDEDSSFQSTVLATI